MKQLPITLSLIFLLHLTTTQSSNNLIEETCKKTPHYELCLSSLESNPESKNSDILGLAHIMINNVLANATDALDLIRNLLKQAPDPQEERSLAYCAELFIPVVKYSLPQAIEALIGGHFGFASYGVSDAAKETDACKKSFSGSNQSPLIDRVNVLHELIDVAEAIISVLLKG
ncbi:hypothetical protein UlMin_009205 [Ulmus minor]